MECPRQNVECKPQINSDLMKLNEESTEKIKESKSDVNIKCEPDWFCNTEEEDGNTMEFDSTIIKSEYEFQSSCIDHIKEEMAEDDSTAASDDDIDDDDDDDDYEVDDDGEYLEENNEKRGEEEKDDELLPSEAEYIGQKRLKIMHSSVKMRTLDSYVIRPCPYCNIDFESFAAWNKHLKQEHNHRQRLQTHFIHSDDGKIKCTDCNKFLNLNFDPVRSHAMSHLPYKNILKCKLCSQIRFRNHLIFHHIEVRHFDVVGSLLSKGNLKNCAVCPYCDKYVGVQHMISKHIQKEHAAVYEQKLWYVCPVCGEEFAKENSRKIHLYNEHKFNTLEGMSLELVEKEYVNNQSKKYRCLKCNEHIVTRAVQGNLHVLMHLEHKLFKCRFCDYAHNQRWKVIKHSCKGLFLDIKTYPNASASRQTAAEDTPVSERGMSRENILCVCPKCGISFEEKSAWEEHLNEEHKFVDYKALAFEKIELEDGKQISRCTICDRKFTRISFHNLRSHAFMHMPFKVHKCKLCAKTLRFSSTCTCHSGAFVLYVCPVCGFESKFLRNCTRHMYQTHQLDQPSGLNFSKVCSNETGKDSFKCAVCDHLVGEPAPLQKDLMFQHAVSHMSFKCYKCSRCGESCDNRATMKHHVQRCEVKLDLLTAEEKANCHRIAKCQCHFCGYLDDSEQNIREHLKSVHQVSMDDDGNHSFIWYCTECEFKFEEEEEIFEHVLTIHLNKRPVQSKLKFFCFVCPLCSVKFQKRAEWESHLYQQHDLNTDEALRVEDSGKSFRCLECFKVLKKKIYAKLSHYLLHCKIRAFKCILCGASFKTTSYAQIHVLSCLKKQKANDNVKRIIYTDDVEEIEEEQANSEASPKKKKKKEKTNMRTQEDKPGYDPLEIDESNVQSFSATSMAVSSSKSSSWNKYCKYITHACPECNIQFETAEEWHLHISSNHDFFTSRGLNMTFGEDGKRVCTECGVKVHGAILHAQRHKLTHLPYQAFICKICHHRSRTHNVLIYHIERRHFTAGEFKCVMCQKVFETSYDCLEHTKRDHTDDEWPENMCRICAKLCSSWSSLRDHMKTHEVNREIFECDICNRRYFSCYELRKHTKQVHPLEYATKVESGELELVINTQVTKNTKKHKRKKMQVINEADKDYYDCLPSNEKRKLNTVSPEDVKRTSRKKIRSKLLAEDSFDIKTEPVSEDEVSQITAPSSGKCSSNEMKYEIKEVSVRIKRDPRVEEALLAFQRIFPNDVKTELKEDDLSFVEVRTKLEPI